MIVFLLVEGRNDVVVSREYGIILFYLSVFEGGVFEYVLFRLYINRFVFSFRLFCCFVKVVSVGREVFLVGGEEEVFLEGVVWGKK